MGSKRHVVYVRTYIIVLSSSTLSTYIVSQIFYSWKGYTILAASLEGVDQGGEMLPKDLKDFETLTEARPQVSKVSNEELVTLLSKQMYTTKEIAAFLKVENGTAFSRLRRLVKAGLITRRWEGNRSYWVAREAVGLEVLPPEESEKEEEA